MNNYGMLQNRKERIRQWHKHPKHAEICRSLRKSAEGLLETGLKFLPQVISIQNGLESAVAATECAAAGSHNLHRGFYCPSPVYDLIVGNVHRGRLLKRITKGSNITHRFSYSQAGMMILCETVLNGHPIFTEYLIYKDDRVYGIMLDNSNALSRVSSEVYHNGRITQYCFVQVVHLQDSSSIFDYYEEQYAYDDDGLCTCVWKSFNPGAETFEEMLLEFQREAGYLVSYTAKDRSIQDGEENNNVVGTYYPRTRRKA